MRKGSIKKIIPLILLSCLIIYFFYFQNNSITISEYQLISEDIPTNFDDFKIVHLSDLHNKSFGENQERLVSKIKNESPDLIFITGDIVDSRRFDPEPSITLVKELLTLGPVYYVPGNHEARLVEYAGLESDLIDAGVHVLRNSMEEFSIGNEQIFIVGIDDPSFSPGGDYLDDQTILDDNIKTALDNLVDKGNYQLLLSHRPELLALYSEYGFNGVFSGHAHGGQIRIPFIGGLVAPNQGLFPKYTEGMHTLDDTTLIINRGLGNSIFPLRIFNRPEIVVLTLKSE